LEQVGVAHRESHITQIIRQLGPPHVGDRGAGNGVSLQRSRLNCTSVVLYGTSDAPQSLGGDSETCGHQG